MLNQNLEDQYLLKYMIEQIQFILHQVQHQQIIGKEFTQKLQLD